MPLRIAVVGLGHMGRIHLNKLLTFDDVSVSAVVDVDAACVAGATSNKSIKGCSRYLEAIDTCDAALIASPTETHYEVGKAFLGAGKHVFMEKPITVTPDQAQELVETAGRKNLVFQIG
ncbi:MAG TPA: Gfo/Idh/MocA family oxidoreductase, partial [Syntrophorhabdaceae bacterium]|nr:Gfo/Idh/MocA family oxidoreductase [Syntrophorhabdaceae bacterium]